MYINGINCSGDRGEHVYLEHNLCYCMWLFNALYLLLTWAGNTWHEILASIHGAAQYLHPHLSVSSTPTVPQWQHVSQCELLLKKQPYRFKFDKCDWLFPFLLLHILVLLCLTLNCIPFAMKRAKEGEVWARDCGSPSCAPLWNISPVVCTGDGSAGWGTSL